MPEFPRKIERQVGVLESFKTDPNDCFARVRVKHRVYQLPLNTRGELQSDGATILLCMNGHRREPIAFDTPIVLDLIFDARGENPCPGMWAPKPRAGAK